MLRRNTRRINECHASLLCYYMLEKNCMPSFYFGFALKCMKEPNINMQQPTPTLSLSSLLLNSLAKREEVRHGECGLQAIIVCIMTCCATGDASAQDASTECLKTLVRSGRKSNVNRIWQKSISNAPDLIGWKQMKAKANAWQVAAPGNRGPS